MSDDWSIEFLDERPRGLRRPLALMDGRGYATTWMWVRRSRSGASETARRPYVARDDGVVFGAGMDRPLEELGLEVGLAEPAEEALWRRPALERYRAGERPDAGEVFARLAAVYDAFVDFGLSLAAQATMCRVMACCSLATWLADAFAVVPYLWLSGERGSGKTQLGTVWAQTSYLGEVVLQSTSYAALRDLAELGAALYFDDAEALTDGRRGDSLKRELLLAGNRRGASVALKEMGDSRWRTRRVSAYTPRAFSAIGRPDATLGSRAIVIPLIRTTDPARGQRDVGDAAAWPCDRRDLLDDLWALGLWLLPGAARAWRELEAERGVVGREYEKWRPVLAAARVLEGRGVVGVEDAVRGVMTGYQEERTELLHDDETMEVVRGLVGCAAQLRSRIAKFPTERERLAAQGWEFPIPTSAIVGEVIDATPDGALAAMGSRRAATRVGQILGRLRYRRSRLATPWRTRAWALRVVAIAETARLYGVPMSEGVSL
jgi:hypothetical protein